MKKLFNKILLASISLIPFRAGAQALNPDVIADMATQDDKLAGAAGYNASATIGSIMATVIQAFLGLLGIIFVVLIVYAGYTWMTAAGEEQKIEKAKDTIQRAIIGLIIIAAAYAITYFVFKSLGGGGGGSYPL